MSFFSRSLLIVLIFVVAACGFDDKHAIDVLMEQRDQAISAMDIDAFAALLSDDFLADGQNKQQKIHQTSILFSQFSQLDMHSHDRVIQLHGPFAECEQNYSLRVLRDQQWRSVVQRERVQLKKTANGWKITGGL